MFDIAFSELALILLVMMIVIGPEKLPKVARTLGLLWARLQRFANNVKNDISHDLAVEDARKLHDKIIQETDAAARELQEDGRTLQQQILQARYQQPSETAPGAVQPSTAPAAPQAVAGPAATPVGGETAAAQPAAGAASAAKPDQPAAASSVPNVDSKQP